MTTTDAKRALYGRNPTSRPANEASSAQADATLEFGRFRVLLRRRQLVSDGLPIELGTRAFDLLLVLLEADGSLVTKEELLSHVWPGVVVSEENLKVQISALRRALGEERDFIRTEFGRGYRFTCPVRSAVARYVSGRPTQPVRRPGQKPISTRSPRRLLTGWLSRNNSARRFGSVD